MNTEKQVFTYTLFVKGVFGRNRTVKFESFDLTGDNDAPLNLDDIGLLATQKAEEINLRKGSWFKIAERKEMISQDGIFAVRKTDLFGDQKVITEGNWS
jgi:hypothetical protein